MERSSARAQRGVERQAPRQERIDFRTTRDNKALIERAAAVLGRSISDFAVSTLVDAAGRIVREHDILNLSTRDQAMLAEALLAPTVPPRRLMEAARRYRHRASRKE